jgi:CHRD domain-containing protein
MKTFRVVVASAIAGIAALGVGAVASAHGNGHGSTKFSERLSSFEEVPALSTPGNGTFRARVDKSSQEIQYKLTFGALGSDATQAHIHFENPTNSGPVVVFLCTNLGNGPAGTPLCPTPEGTVTGTLRPADVVGPAAQGIAPGEFDELVDAIRAGYTYANVHSQARPAGEIRAQLEHGPVTD